MSKFTPNSFQVPNAFVDEVLNKISDPACKIYLVICRKTRGWNKEMDSISLSQLEEITGKSRPTVIKAKNELVKVGLIIELPSTIYGNTYKLGDETGIGLAIKFPSKEFLLPKITSSASKKVLLLLVKVFNYASKEFLPLLVKDFYTQKTLSKNTIQNKKINKKRTSVSEKQESKNESLFDPKTSVLPAGVQYENWIGFLEMRKAIRKPLNTERAVNLILKKLETFGEYANAALETSITNSYQGVFFPREVSASHHQYTGNQNLPEEPGYFTQMFEQQNGPDAIDVTPDYIQIGG